MGIQLKKSEECQFWQENSFGGECKRKSSSIKQLYLRLGLQSTDGSSFQRKICTCTY